MKMQRRDFIQSFAALGAASGSSLFAAPLLAAEGAAPSASRQTAPEWLRDAKTGMLHINPDYCVRHSVCLQCHGECGIRAKVERKTGKLVRLVGNPWHPNTKINYTDMSVPIDQTATDPGTLCARGVSGVQVLYDPYRVRVPLKRTGPRGANEWKVISWKELLDEVVDGGKIFSDVNDPLSKDIDVRGFRWLYEHRNEPMDPNNPDYGNRTNGLVLQGGRIVKSRKDFQSRFANSFGTVNNYEHTNICEQSHHIATGETFGGKHNFHADLCNSEFVMYWGTAPGEANFPMQTLGKYSAYARAHGCKIVVVDPVLPVTVTTNPNMKWVAVRPGTDGALAMGMLQVIIDEKRYNASFLSSPNDAAAQKAGELNATNASWLVVTDEKSPSFGKFLSVQEAGLDGKGAVVIDAQSGKPAAASASSKAIIDYAGTVNNVKVKSVFRLLSESAHQKTVKEYSAICGVAEDEIRQLAREMTSHGRKAVAEFYRGIAQHPNGYYTGLAINALNVMVGNLNWTGGASTGGGSYDYAKGHYDLSALPGLEPAAKGLRISREKAHYENSSEFKRLQAAGRNPYPARRPWFPFSSDIYSEIIPSALEGYPYKADILFWHMATPLYAAPGQANAELVEKIKDPHNIPLILASDIVIGDSSIYADYIIPDITYLERYVHVAVPDTLMSKGIGVRYPVVEALTEKTDDGRPFCYETFLIDVAKRLGMAGFGDKAIPDADGKLWPLNRMEDYYIKATANVAYSGSPCADATDEDIAVAGLADYYKKFKDCVKPSEWKKVLYIMSRGGRFEPVVNRYAGDKLGHPNKKLVSLYSEKVAMGIDSMTGKHFCGIALWQQPQTILGKDLAAVDNAQAMPFVIVTQKSPLQSHSRLPACTIIREIRPENAAEINPEDGRRLGIKTGDEIIVKTATGQRRCKALLREGVAPGVISFIVGYGHTGYGAAKGRIGGKTLAGDPERARGVNLNPIMRLDPDIPMMALMDPIGGSAAFYDTRAQIVKL